jgi:hypothetical protein
MIKRITTLTGALAALAALALGGSAIATAQSHAKPHKRAVHHAQRTADTPTAATDGDNVQSDDQTTPDNTIEATGSESTNESASTETDGPGGHQDPNGVNVDHQFQGQE